MSCCPGNCADSVCACCVGCCPACCCGAAQQLLIDRAGVTEGEDAGNPAQLTNEVRRATAEPQKQEQEQPPEPPVMEREVKTAAPTIATVPAEHGRRSDASNNQTRKAPLTPAGQAARDAGYQTASGSKEKSGREKSNGSRQNAGGVPGAVDSLHSSSGTASEQEQRAAAARAVSPVTKNFPDPNDPRVLAAQATASSSTAPAPMPAPTSSAAAGTAVPGLTIRPGSPSGDDIAAARAASPASAGSAQLGSMNSVDRAALKETLNANIKDPQFKREAPAADATSPLARPLEHRTYGVETSIIRKDSEHHRVGDDGGRESKSVISNDSRPITPPDAKALQPVENADVAALAAVAQREKLHTGQFVQTIAGVYDPKNIFGTTGQQQPPAAGVGTAQVSPVASAGAPFFAGVTAALASHTAAATSDSKAANGTTAAGATTGSGASSSAFITGTISALASTAASQHAAAGPRPVSPSTTTRAIAAEEAELRKLAAERERRAAAVASIVTDADNSNAQTSSALADALSPVQSPHAPSNSSPSPRNSHS